MSTPRRTSPSRHREPTRRRDLVGWAQSPSTPRAWLIALMMVPVGAVAWLGTRTAAPIVHPRSAPVVTEVDEATPVRVAVRVHCDDAMACALAESLALDVWSEHRGVGLPLDIVVPEGAVARLREAGLSPTILVPDIDAVAAAEAARLRDHEAARPGDWYGEFRDFEAIGGHLAALARAHPERAELSIVGGSVEGRPLLALRIGGGAGTTPMLVNGTQHAREWIAAMVSTCVAERLLEGYATDSAIREFVDATELWVVPVVNPDGYQYAWSSDRYWRKNRRGGHGVDLNRNFSVAFGGAGSSNQKRSEIYRGEYAFSEPETQALRDLVRREAIALHVDFHAYGQLVLHPWNYTAAPAKQRDRYAAIGDRIVSAIFATHGTRYTLKAGAQLYPAAGTMSDWMHGEATATSFTIELRPKGGSGFVLPPEQIRPSCDEGLAAVLELRAAHGRTPAAQGGTGADETANDVARSR